MGSVQTVIQALHHAQAGDWKDAHSLIDELEHPLAYWLHASLHREEGDRDNARYWYGRAGRPFSEDPFGEERAQIEAAARQASEK